MVATYTFSDEIIIILVFITIGYFNLLNHLGITKNDIKIISTGK